jgi:hypothetical protein
MMQVLLSLHVLFMLVGLALYSPLLEGYPKIQNLGFWMFVVALHAFLMHVGPEVVSLLG